MGGTPDWHRAKVSPLLSVERESRFDRLNLFLARNKQGSGCTNIYASIHTLMYWSRKINQAARLALHLYVRVFLSGGCKLSASNPTTPRLSSALVRSNAASLRSCTLDQYRIQWDLDCLFLPEAELEVDTIAGRQCAHGMPAGEKHSGSHLKGMSSRLPNTVDHGIPLQRRRGILMPRR
jgi:hypothetical protein